MKRFYGGIISGTTNITGSGFLSPATVQLQPSSTTTMNATGGTISYSGNYKIHTFLTSGTFTVISGVNVRVEYTCVGGGAGGANGTGTGNYGGGGGAGGFLENMIGDNDGSDFIGYRMIVSAGDVINAVVGGGGGTTGGHGSLGGASYISSSSRTYAYSLGGGGGAISNVGGYNAVHGGANGGGNWQTARETTVQTLAGVNYSPKQGISVNNKLDGCGSGGSGTVRATMILGRTSSINGNTYSTGGLGGQASIVAGAANTGNGGTGGANSGAGASGGSGIVILRYLYQ